MKTQHHKAVKIQVAIRHILHDEWNPFNGDVPVDEYDSSIAPLYRILGGNRSEQALVEFLSMEEKNYGVTITTNDHNEKLHLIALHLLALDVG